MISHHDNIRYTAKQEEQAKAACLAAGQRPDSYIDYTDLRADFQNWQYFLPDSVKVISS